MNMREANPNEFEGTDIERINKAVAAAAAGDGRVVIPRVNRGGGPADQWLIDSAILLPANITVDLDGCRIKLSDRCRDNFFRSANCGLDIPTIHLLRNIHIRGHGGARLEGADHPRATGDGAKILGEPTYGTDAGVEGESQFGDWRNIGILLASVSDFSIENIAMHDSHAWAMSLEYCGHGRLRDLHFESSGSKIIDGEPRVILNQDGIDLRRGCHDILIENITGYTGDDLIALTGILRADNAPQPAGRLKSTMISGTGNDERDHAIHHIIIRNVMGFSMGGHSIVRFLNNGGVTMHDIVLDGLIDTSGEHKRSRSAVRIGDTKYGGLAPLGDTSRFIISNVISRATDTILIVGTLSESIISNVMKHDAPLGTSSDPVVIQAGAEHVRNVSIEARPTHERVGLGLTPANPTRTGRTAGA